MARRCMIYEEQPDGSLERCKSKATHGEGLVLKDRRGLYIYVCYEHWSAKDSK